MFRAFAVFALLMLVMVGAAYAGVWDVLSKAAGAVNPLAGFAVGTIGSLVTGKGMKDKTKIENDAIPAANVTLWAGTAGAVTQDPLTTLATVLGAVFANWLHQLGKRFTT